MKYICLIAGLGTRLELPYLQKGMYPIFNKPFVAYSIDNIPILDDDELIFVVNHKQEQVREYFGEEYNGLKITYVIQKIEEGKSKGTGVAVYQACEELGIDEAIIFHADQHISKEIFEAILKSKENSIAYGEYFGKKVNYQLDIENNEIIKFWKGDDNYVDAGIWRFTKEIMLKLKNFEFDGEYRVLHNLEQLKPEVSAIKVNKELNLDNIQEIYNDTSRLTK